MSCKVQYTYTKAGWRILTCQNCDDGELIRKPEMSDFVWDIEQALFVAKHPKTSTQILTDVFGKKCGIVPKYQPEEIIKPYWQWQGNIYVERPNVGGMFYRPNVKYPVRAIILDESKYGRLWSLIFEWSFNTTRGWRNMRTVPVRVLNVWNATKESDGSRQAFTLRVPQNVRTAHEAAAWTFNKTPITYSPLKEA